MRISDYLRQQHILIDSPCGGAGKCGGCKVLIWSKDEPEKSKRYVLACQTEMEDNLVVQYRGVEVSGESVAEIPVEFNPEWREGPQLLAVDLGSTTIAVKNLTTGETAVGENHQRTYGHDIISRIDAAVRGYGRELRDLMVRDLTDLGERVHFRGGKILISGNTAMEHLLEGQDVTGLSKAPFQPGDITYHRLGEENIYLMPGFSAFVGGDIVSGVYKLDMDLSEEYNLLLDLGTNGEMVLGNRDGFYITSTAAGPAFEGGNIKRGVAGIPGAITDVNIKKGFSRVETIDGKPAVGICGAGVVSACANLLLDGDMDRSGLLAEEYREDGFVLYRRMQGDEIYFTQEDIRQVQLAKAAIRAGIEILIASSGIRIEEIAHVYLAGGLGNAISVEAAVQIGLLPEELANRVVAVSNTSLGGAERFLREESSENGALDLQARMKKIPGMAKEILLANHEDFGKYYLQYLNF